MKDIDYKQLYAQMIDGFARIDLSSADPLILIALGISIIALLVALFRGRGGVSRRGSKNVHSRLQELNLKFADLDASLIPEVVALKREFKVLRGQQSTLTQETVELADKLFDLQRSDLDRTQQEEFNKKNEKERKEKEAAQVAVKVKELVEGLAVAKPEVIKEEVVGKSVSSGLRKTRQSFLSRLKTVFKKQPSLQDAEFDALEELLIGSDLGVNTCKMLLSGLSQATAAGAGQITEAGLRDHLKKSITQILRNNEDPEIIAQKHNGQPLVVLMIGVNGVGKTTTIAKLADQFKRQGARVILGACDTFRAAASEQLEVWANKVGVDIVTAQEGAKPSAVAYETIHKGQDGNFDVVILDTAGRLHTRTNLMDELKGIINIVAREQPGAPHETLLVLDAATGQNALAQAREFHDLSNLTGVVVTKLDGTPKGGIVVAIKDELGVPIRYIGIGEGVADLRPFSAEEFVDALFDTEEGESVDLDVNEQAQDGAPVAKARRKRRDSLNA